MERFLVQDSSAKKDFRSVAGKIAVVFILGYGLHYFGYFIRARYYDWLDTLSISDGFAHAAGYLGHCVFLIVMAVFAILVVHNRKYFFRTLGGSFGRNLKYALIGAAAGFGQMGICVFCAAKAGNLSISTVSNGMTAPLFIFALFAVLIQASTEEIESRGFVFGKMYTEGVSLIPAAIASSLYFSYLHAANPGFTWFSLLSLFVTGVMYVMSYYYFGTIWYACTAHMMWNFTQDFIFGLPDSGRPAAASLFTTDVNGSGFFYDQDFGIEGSWMALITDVIFLIIIVLIGRKIRKNAMGNKK